MYYLFLKENSKFQNQSFAEKMMCKDKCHKVNLLFTSKV